MNILKMAQDTNMYLLCSNSFGIYVPQLFAEEYGELSNISEEDLAILLEGPGHEDYWECWADVVDSIELRSADRSDHKLYYLYESDGDLWAVLQGTEPEFE